MSLGLYFDDYAGTGTDQAALPVVLLHGWGMHSLVWDNIMPALLALRPVRVIDLPGMGRSPLPGGEYTLDFIVEQVLKVAPPRAVWMGWSLGGMVAARLAERYPERVAGLVTVATNPRFVADARWPHAVQDDVLTQFRSLFAEDWQGTLIRFLALQCKDAVTMKEDIRLLKDAVFHHGLPATKALRCGLEILQHIDLRDSYPQLQMPVLHVFGERDNLVPVAVQEDLKTLHPAAQVAVISGASHLPFVSAPAEFMSVVEAFLNGRFCDGESHDGESLNGEHRNGEPLGEIHHS